MYIFFYISFWLYEYMHSASRVLDFYVSFSLTFNCLRRPQKNVNHFLSILNTYSDDRKERMKKSLGSVISLQMSARNGQQLGQFNFIDIYDFHAVLRSLGD
jgi:hypothetical protein